MYSRISIAVLFLLTIVGTSCLYMGPSVRGNGRVVEQLRDVPAFHGVRVTSGMNLQLVQGDTDVVIVVADENLQEVIETRVNDGILEIRALAGIRQATEKKVVVTTRKIREINGTAGSNISMENRFELDQLKIKGSAGSNIHANLDVREAEISATAGANLFLQGNADDLTIKVSAGANVKAGEFSSKNSNIKVSSGGNVWVTANETFAAHASSGGNIFYYGQPSNTNITTSSGGNVLKRN